MRHLLRVTVLLLSATFGPQLLSAQNDAREVTELRRRIVEIRKQLPAITEAAEYAAGLFKDDPTKRLLVPKAMDPGFMLEFRYRAGGPPETQDAGDPSARGLVLLPIRHWDGIGLGVAMQAEQFQLQGRPVVSIGPAVDRPSLPVGRRFLDNGATTSDRGQGDLSAIANLIVGWTWYAEVVAAATRDGWWTGTYLSVLVPGATQHNADVRFRMPTPPPAILPPGSLGAAYLDAVDALLTSAETPAQRQNVQRAADSLLARKRDGGRLFVASCGHYLLEELPRDSLSSPFRAVDWRWDVGGKVRAAGATAGDAMLWFGYGGYDCPNVDVAGTFRDAGLSVVVVTDKMPAGPLPKGVSAHLPLHWKMPDAGAPIPYAPGAVGALASIDMAVHYLWLKRLVSQ